jgi:membrane protease YdiL (CAAX protease family)
MKNVLNIFGEIRIFDSNGLSWPQANKPEVVITAVFLLILFFGAALLIYWLSTTSLGRAALDDSRPRRNSMAVYIPLIPFFIWIFLSIVGGSIVGRIKDRFEDWQQELLVLGFTAILAMVIFVITIFIVRRYFVRGFKGFGIDLKTIWKDIGGAVVKLLAVWPLVLGTLLLTTAIGKLIYGEDFEIQKHEELESLIKYPQLSIRLAVLFMAVVAAPLNEELLFRGIFQSGFRNITAVPWAPVIISSAIFAMAHQNPAHWPALFVLSMGLGYAYEKSGSLIQPIFMHSLFNGIMVTATLFQF